MPHTTENSWGAELGTLEGSDNVNSDCIAFSPNGQLLAAGTFEGTIRLWNAVTGNLLQELSSEWDYPRAIVFSPDSKLLISCSGKQMVFGSDSITGALQFWDTTTGTLQSTLYEDVRRVTSLVFTNDDRLLASPSNSWDFLTWDRFNGVQKHMLAERLPNYTITVLSLDGLLLASYRFNTNIFIWDVLTSNLQQTLVCPGNVVCMSFSPNSQILASIDRDGIIILWNTTTGVKQQQMRSFGNAENLTFSPNGQLLASSHEHRRGPQECDTDGIIGLWDLNTYKLVRTLKGLQGAVYSTHFSPDGDTLLSVSKYSNTRRLITLWDATDISPAQNSHPSYSRAMAFSVDGQLLASVQDSGTIVVWNVTNESVIRNLRDQRGTDQVEVLAFSPNSTLLACSSDAGSIGVWDIIKDTKRHSIRGASKTHHVAFSPDSLLMACSDSDKRMRLWDLNTGTLQRVLNIGSRSSLSFSPNGRLLALYPYDLFSLFPAEFRKIEIWDHSTGHLLHASQWKLNEIYLDRKTRKEYDFSALKLWNPKTGGINERLETVAASSSGSKGLWIIIGECIDDSDLYTQSDRVIEIDDHAEWISYHGRRVLWIPSHYDTYCWAMSNNTLALGHYSGSVTFIKFSPQAAP